MGMLIPTLHSLIIGFSSAQHAVLLHHLKLAHQPLRINERALKPDSFDLVLKSSSIDVVFVRYDPKANFQPLQQRLSGNNKDCILVELIDPLVEAYEVATPLLSVVQTCRVTHNPEFREFHLALKFVMQYVILKKDFRHCKSLLYLSENRAMRLVDSSNQAIAFVDGGNILHANLPFLAMFSAESLSELKRFSLRKLIAEDESEVFADYITNVNRSPKLSISQLLTMRKVSGAPFSAKIQASRVVLKERHCYQLWVEQRVHEPNEEVIPVTKALNAWDFPDTQANRVGPNPFDRVFEKSTIHPENAENNLEVLQRELLTDAQVKLRFRELYQLGRQPLKIVWAKLDIDPEEFRMVNALLSQQTQNVSATPAYANFWDQLMFKLVLQAVSVEKSSEQMYLVTLSANLMADSKMVLWLTSQLQVLGNKAKQLTLLVDAEMPMDRIPRAKKAIGALKSTGCNIGLNNFSANTTPLFLFKHINPKMVIFHNVWIDELKARNDDGLFIKHFVTNLENLDVSAFIPQAHQKHQDRLFVLTGASFSQETTTQDCA